MDLKSKIRIINNYPKEGISFKDITTLLNDKVAFQQTVDLMVDHLKEKNIDVVVGPEARGFVFGSAVAYALGVRFVPVRKPGKLPADTSSYTYQLEYGTDTLEIHKDALKPGDRVAIVDDLLATGGTVLATCKLIEQQGAEVVQLEFVIELKELNGLERVKDYPVHSLVEYDH